MGSVNNILPAFVSLTDHQLDIQQFLPQKNEKMFCQNYRPISLLNNISKVFEHAVYNTFYDYLTSNNLLNPKMLVSKRVISQLISYLYISQIKYIKQLLKAKMFVWYFLMLPRHLAQGFAV